MEIKNYPNYLIFRNGAVLSKGFDKWHPPRFLKQYLQKSTGYYMVNLYKDKKPTPYRIHRLVAEHYIPNPDNKPEVDHIDRNKTNNKLSNLRWVTYSENTINTDINSKNTSGYKNISYDKSRNKWCVLIKRTYLKWYKRFNKLEDAIEYRDKIIDHYNFSVLFEKKSYLRYCMFDSFDDLDKVISNEDNIIIYDNRAHYYEYNQLPDDMKNKYINYLHIRKKDDKPITYRQVLTEMMNCKFYSKNNKEQYEYFNHIFLEDIIHKENTIQYELCLGS